jgi:hypothetical protein
MIAFYHQNKFYVSINLLFLLDESLPNIKGVSTFYFNKLPQPLRKFCVKPIMDYLVCNQR